MRKSFVLLAHAWLKLGKQDLGFSVILEGLGRFPDDPELHYAYAQALTGANRFEEAKAEYEKVLGKSPDGLYSSLDHGIFGYLTLDHLGELEHVTGHYVEAKKHWLAALEKEPTYLTAAFNLFRAALDVHDLLTARSMTELVRRLEGFGQSWTDMATEYAKSIGGEQAALEALGAAIRQDSRAVAPRLKLAEMLLKSGSAGLAVPHLEHLCACGVPDAAFFLGQYESSRGRLAAAKRWYERALELNPGHQETQRRIDGLTALLGESPLGIAGA